MKNGTALTAALTSVMCHDFNGTFRVCLNDSCVYFKMIKTSVVKISKTLRVINSLFCNLRQGYWRMLEAMKPYGY